MHIEDQNEAVVTAPESGNTAAPETVETTTPEEQEPKTFTQEELDRIIAAEKAKVERKLRREMTQQVEQPQRQATAAPDPNQFKTAEEYVDALSDWKADQKLADREAQQQRAKVDSTYEERAETVREKYDDFDAVVYKQPHEGGPAISPYMAEAIKESEMGPEIAYFLGKNTKEARRIFDMTPLAQAREIGKIEASLVATPPVGKKASSAPEPIKPIGSRSATPKYDTLDPRSIGTMSPSEWIKAENERRAKQSR